MKSVERWMQESEKVFKERMKEKKKENEVLNEWEIQISKWKKCVWKTERKNECLCVWEDECDCVCVCVRVCGSKREWREREREEVGVRQWGDRKWEKVRKSERKSEWEKLRKSDIVREREKKMNIFLFIFTVCGLNVIQCRYIEIYGHKSEPQTGQLEQNQFIYD